MSCAFAPSPAPQGVPVVVAPPPSAGAAYDPFAGMSEEDRAAVQAAMAEMESEAEAAREAGAWGAGQDPLEEGAGEGHP